MVFSCTLKYGNLFKIAFGDGSPEVMGKVADQQLIDQVNGPENIMDKQQDPAVI